MSPITSAQVRDILVHALELDLVGPTPDDTEHAREIISSPPTKWYLTGFLCPKGAPLKDRIDDDRGQDDLDTSLSRSDRGEDSYSPEEKAARTAPFPSSVGLTFLLKNTIKEIDGNSDQIIKIAKFIMDIFKQVNLLSLNTSIEVARAEESGRDFAVITEEISKLATRIDSNIKNIHSIITNNKNSTEKGYNNVLETSRLFNRVIIDLNTIQNVIEEIIQSKLRLEDENIAVKHIITQFENQILFMNAYLLKIS